MSANDDFAEMVMIVEVSRGIRLGDLESNISSALEAPTPSLAQVRAFLDGIS